MCDLHYHNLLHPSHTFADPIATSGSCRCHSQDTATDSSDRAATPAINYYSIGPTNASHHSCSTRSVAETCHRCMRSAAESDSRQRRYRCHGHATSLPVLNAALTKCLKHRESADIDNREEDTNLLADLIHQVLDPGRNVPRERTLSGPAIMQAVESRAETQIQAQLCDALLRLLGPRPSTPVASNPSHEELLARLLRELTTDEHQPSTPAITDRVSGRLSDLLDVQNPPNRRHLHDLDRLDVLPSNTARHQHSRDIAFTYPDRPHARRATRAHAAASGGPVPWTSWAEERGPPTFIYEPNSVISQDGMNAHGWPMPTPPPARRGRKLRDISHLGGLWC